MQVYIRFECMFNIQCDYALAIYTVSQKINYIFDYNLNFLFSATLLP